MKKLRILTAVAAIFGLLYLATPQVAAVSNSATYVAQGNPRCASRLLTLPVWYRGLTQSTNNCELDIDDNPGFLWVIGLNVIEMLMHVVGYVAAVFVLIGGFRYITSVGEPDRISGAKKTITNAILGLVIALLSIAVINFIVAQVT